jgi:signal transduction histidine kinase
LDDAQQQLGRLGEVVHGALKEMRLLVYELRPAVLQQDGLVAALQKRLDAVEGRAGIATRLLVAEEVDLPPEVEVALYHVVQEALNNALKHASASSVAVRIAVEGGSLLLDVEDDGAGFVPGAPDDAGGLGLVAMRQRVERLGGRLQITSVPGAGTRVRVELGQEVLG